MHPHHLPPPLAPPLSRGWASHAANTTPLTPPLSRSRYHPVSAASSISFSASAAIQLLSARQSHTASSISSSTAVAHAATLRSCARLVTRLLLLCCSCRHSALLRQAGHTALFPPPLAPPLLGSYAASFLSCKGLFHTSSPARQGSTLVHNGNPSFATHFSLRAACRSQVREEVRREGRRCTASSRAIYR